MEKITAEMLRLLKSRTDIAKEIGEPEKISGKQELFESLVNQYLH